MSNILLYVLTFGFARPYIIHRTFNFYAKAIKVKGELSEKIIQTAKDSITSGEGLAALLDVDIAIA